MAGFGIGQTVRRAEDFRFLTGGLLGYCLPRADDLPEAVSEPSPLGSPGSAGRGPSERRRRWSMRSSMRWRRPASTRSGCRRRRACLAGDSGRRRHDRSVDERV